MAQLTNADDPVGVVRDVLVAYEAQAWPRVAELTHPDALASFETSICA